MILTTARETIAETFAAAWVTAQPTVPFTLDNELFDPPASGPWVRLSIQMQAASQDSMGPVGGRKFLRAGTIFVQVFSELDTGTKTHSLLCESAKDIVEGISLGGGELPTYTASVRDLGSDGRWHMSTVAVPFDFQETR